MHHTSQDRCTERIRLAIPRSHDQPQGFAVDLFAHLVVQLESGAHAADAVIAQLQTVIVECQPHPVGSSEKCLGRSIASHDLGTQLDACRQWCGVSVLLCKEQCFLLHRQSGVDLAENRQVLTAVTEDAPLNGVLTVHHIILAVAEADLRLVGNVLVEVGSNHLHTLTLHPPLIDLAGIDQHLAVKHQHLVRWSDIKGSSIIVRVIFQAHLISSLIRQMYFSASVKISVTCFLRFGLVSKLGLKVKLYSSRWIIA